MLYFHALLAKLEALAQAVLLAVLAAGPVPQHVAFVMDGNRRYARRRGRPVRQGHSDGFLALQRVLEICLKLGVKCVTAYAFSIENFKREEGEVRSLLEMAEEKLRELCQEGKLLEEYGVRLNVLGRTELFPPSLQAAIAQAEALTKAHDRAILNLCMPYTSRDEMTAAVEGAVRESVEARLHSATPDLLSPITERDIEKHLYTARGGSPPLDVLVRTSGVKRLSDFMLWQACEDTQIHFIRTFWPDFGLRELLPIVLDYQRKVARRGVGSVVTRARAQGGTRDG